MLILLPHRRVGEKALAERRMRGWRRIEN